MDKAERLGRVLFFCRTVPPKLMGRVPSAMLCRPESCADQADPFHPAVENEHLVDMHEGCAGVEIGLESIGPRIGHTNGERFLVHLENNDVLELVALLLPT